MGANLARGCVKDGRIVCPLHGWEYAPDGRCERIPSSNEIPAFAMQKSFPVEERCGLVFFFNAKHARFPLPFFNGIEPETMTAAKPINLLEDAPWYLIGANGFDKQHFEKTHDRPLLAEPMVDQPHPFAMRNHLELAIGGTSHTDRLTRTLAGKQSQMTITSWCGTLIFATARFRKTTTCGLVAVHPLPNHASRVQVIGFVPRSGNAFARAVIDPLHAAVRRHFISAFFQSDLGKLVGTRYNPNRMIPADKMLVDYLDWLHKIHRP